MLCFCEILNVQQGDEVAQAASTYLGEQRRRSTRLEQTSPVIIRGVDLLGQPFEERTAAQNLSFHGCRYASKHHLPKNTWVTLEVPSGESRGDAACVRARVAWIQRPQTLRDLFQVGVELERGNNVWGVTLPPNDWNGGAATVTTISIAAEMPPLAEETALSTSTTAEPESSLEVYLQMAIAHAKREAAPTSAIQGMLADEKDELLMQLRQEFIAESKRTIEEARAAADQVATQRASELRGDIESAQETTAAFHKKWLDEFEHKKVDAREEIVASLTESVATQLASFEQQVRGTFPSDWAERLSHAQVERSEWQAEIQALREEVRSSAETSDRRSEEWLKEKLVQIRQDLESSRASKMSETEAPPAATESVRNALLAETETARAQWSELLESSLDSAAQRLNERLSSCSQELLQRSEHELAKRLVELQKETGLTVEARRAALSELKAALETEVTQAKTALSEIEQMAGRFSDYSRQLEAASQDSLHELRERLESSVGQQCAELERRGTELEGKFSENAAQLLEEMTRDAVARGAQEIGAIVSSGLERAGKASQDLAAREEQAEGILRIHRERLRQVSEQVQREGAAHLAAGVSDFQKDLENLSERALAHWKASLEANGMRVAEDASAALAKETARQLVESDAQLLVQIQQTLDSAQERMRKSAHVIAGEFRGGLGEIEEAGLANAKEKFAAAADERLELARNEFTKAAEKAASTFGEVIEEATENRLRDFSAMRDASAKDGEERLAAAAEKILQGVHNHAQSSFEHFDEQLAIKIDQALKRANERLEHQFELTLDRFRERGERNLEDWTAKQTSVADHALEKHEMDLRSAANSWVETALEQLDARSEERIDSAVRTTQNAVREACADIFESVAQGMKKQLQGTREMRHAAAGETNSQEHRASA